ncbi:MAG TPA: glycerol-3-phosphate acyltransferase, partial [Reyranella sp.]|nr:glycerol-3-phosphate acyltransferase [Reyranella sp.]
VATTLGVLIGLSWQLGAITCALWLVLAALFRYSSLAALLSILIGAVAAWYFVPVAAPVLCLLAALVWVRHHENIRRLLNGTEPKIGKKATGVA